MYFTKLMITAIILIKIDDVSSSIKIDSNYDSKYYANNTKNNYYISEVLRRYKRQAVNNGKNCEIPLNPLFTKYIILGEFETNYRPGDFVDQYSNLEIRCNKGYALSPLATKRSICLNGKWSDEPTGCLATCQSLISTETTTVKCSYNDIPLKDCINPVKGTVVRLSCNSLYEESSIQRNPIRVCDGYLWYPYISHCSPICGIKHPRGVTNIVNSAAAQIGDYPWQIGLYKSTNKEFFCGGFMIDQHVILTAAHCITDYDGNVQPASNYLVAAGKYFRKYDEDGDHLAQYSNISAIHVPDRYSGRFNMFASDIAILILTNPFTLTDAVQPVCIELNEVSSYISLSPYDEGIVTGWGYTEEGGQLSDVLKELIIPYIPYNKCFNEIPSHFKRYFTQDKICGGYKNNATSVCRGDSGGALVFKNMYSDRYYVQGIVSTSPATIALTCDSNQYSLFTYVNIHIRFIRDIVAKNQLRQTVVCVSDDCTDELHIEGRNMPTKGCLLPDMPENGKYSFVDNNTVYAPGNYVPLSTKINLICDDWYTAIDTNSSVCADTGNWQPKLGMCELIIKFLPDSIEKNLSNGEDPSNGKHPCSLQNVLDECGALRCEYGSQVYRDEETDCTKCKCNEHTAAVDDNLEKLITPPVPDISKHKNFNLLASTSDCGIYPIKKRIFNGVKTDLFEYPWMVLLTYNDTDSGQSFKCAGTIINDRYILTAAYCIIDSPYYRLVGVRVGEHNINSNPDCETEGENISVCADPVQDIEIEDVIPHQNFSVIHKNNNIGLLRLRAPIQFKRSVWPICLPINNEYRIENFTNTRLIITGWGYTSCDGTGLSMDLLKAEVSVVSEEECKDLYKTNINIDHTSFCAGGPEGDPCQRDSGVPLQGAKLVDNDLQYVQYGIATFGTSCCGTAPGVYTRIDYFIDWILDNIKV